MYWLAHVFLWISFSKPALTAPYITAPRSIGRSRTNNLTVSTEQLHLLNKLKQYEINNYYNYFNYETDNDGVPDFIVDGEDETSFASEYNGTFPNLGAKHRKKRQSLDYNLEGYTKGCRITLELFPKKIIKLITPYHGRKQYPAGLKCEWEIIGQETCVPVAACDAIDLRKSEKDIGGECDDGGDQLVISDGALAEKQYCGPDLGFTHPVKGIKGVYLYVTLSTNADSTYFDRLYKGIYCHVHCHDSPLLPSTQHQLPPAEPPKEEYKRLCGQKFNEGNNRIVGGETAKKDEFPWQAALVLADTRKPFCGGSLINNKFILTAAHCLLDDEGNILDADKIGILLRGHVLDQSLSPTSDVHAEFGQEGSIKSPGFELNQNDPQYSKDDLIIKIDEMIVHQFYNKYTDHDCDIALLRLKRSLPLSSKDVPTPVCLPDIKEDAKDYTGQIATVSGWGRAHELSGGSTKILQKLNVPVLADALCQEMYAEEETQITENMFCAGYEEGGKDACSGDSGGPITIQEGKRQVQIGVVSFGKGCARERRPGVYTKITKFLPWIRYHTKNSVWPRSKE